jgi:hypothetical protein
VEQGPEGWYPDPQGLADERYFDGANWTDRTRATQVSSSPASTAAPRGREADVAPALARAASRLGTVANVLALIVLILGIASVVIVAGVSLLAIGDPSNDFNDSWGVGLLTAVVVLFNTLLAWVLLKSISIIAEYIWMRALTVTSSSVRPN